MLRVYNYMAAGVASTGVVAWLTFQLVVTTTSAGTLALTPFGQAIYGTPLNWILMLAPLGLVFFISFRTNALSAGTARALSFVYAASPEPSVARSRLRQSSTSSRASHRVRTEWHARDDGQPDQSQSPTHCTDDRSGSRGRRAVACGDACGAMTSLSA